jgi:hypothetical protein
MDIFKEEKNQITCGIILIIIGVGLAMIDFLPVQIIGIAITIICIIGVIKNLMFIFGFCEECEQIQYKRDTCKYKDNYCMDCNNCDLYKNKNIEREIK